MADIAPFAFILFHVRFTDDSHSLFCQSLRKYIYNCIKFFRSFVYGAMRTSRQNTNLPVFSAVYSAQEIGCDIMDIREYKSILLYGLKYRRRRTAEIFFACDEVCSRTGCRRPEKEETIYG